MKKIIKSFAVIVAVIAVAGGVTWSYFSDTEESLDNTFSAGTLDIMLDKLHPSHVIISEAFPMENMMPGDESDLIRQGIALESGSAQPDHLELRVTTSNFVDPNGDSTEEDFQKMIILTDFSMNGAPDWDWYGFNQHTLRGNDGDSSSLSLYDVVSAGILDDIPMEHETRELRMRYKFSETAGNEFQGDSLDINFEIGAAQVAGQDVL